ncbi:dUTP diphosphatase [Peptococcaceae bacterium]|nr:dUTP diphosphatase [Peptococcaceae bacterium]MCL0051875.1 dUTP diphosphatase [Peptococcaceae bacterium]MCL0101272.1 dUTP diphosphatase [Peptococcaceae bacterium]
MKKICSRCKYGFEIIVRGDYKCEIQEIKIAKEDALSPTRNCKYFALKEAIIKVKKLHPNAKIPQKATDGSAGFDLHCIEEKTVNSGEHCTLSTGLAFEIPQNYVMLIYARSGYAKKYGITLSNAVGVIDSDYRGEVKILIHNTGKTKVTFKPNDRVAQAIIHKLPDIEIIECDELSKTDRDTKGFGSTGR